ncbi:MAG: hypothetical protein RR307_00560 [Clostridia bacterium]
MKLLKVICTAATGNSVFEFGAKTVSYDWENSVLLADCLSQVFYNCESTWSGNIEIYFELKGKNYCAGRKMYNGKYSNYLAGEVKNKLLLLAFDNESMHAYLDDEVGCDFSMILERCFVSETNFERFVKEPSADYFGFIKQAVNEKRLSFDMAQVEELSVKTAKVVLKSEVDNIKIKRDNINMEYKQATLKQENLKVLVAQLSEAVERQRKAEQLHLKKDELIKMQVEIEKLKKANTDSEKAKEAEKIQNEKKKEIEEINRIKVEKENELKKAENDIINYSATIIALTNAERYVKQQKEYEIVESEIKELNNNKKRLINKNNEQKLKAENINKEKEEAEKEGADEQKAQMEKDKKQKQLIEAEKELDSCKKVAETIANDIKLNAEKIEKAQKELAEVDDKRQKSKAVITEIDAVGFTQESYDVTIKEERERRAQYNKTVVKFEEAEKIRIKKEEEKKKENDSKMLKFNERINELINLISEIDLKEEELSAEKEEALFDINPKNAVVTDKKYFGKGYTPFEVYSQKKFLKGRITEIDGIYANNIQLKKQYNKELENLLKQTAVIDVEPMESKKAIPEYVEKFLFDENELTAIQKDYVLALKNGKGAQQKKAATDALATFNKRFDELSEIIKGDNNNLVNQEKSAALNIKKAEDKVEILKKEQIADIKIHKFEKQAEYDNIIKDINENEKEIAKIDEQLVGKKATKPTVLLNDSERSYVKNSAIIISLMAKNKSEEDKLNKQIEKLKKECENLTADINNKEKSIDKINITCSILDDEQIKKNQAAIDNYERERAENDCEISKLGDVPIDATKQIAEVNNDLAECGNVIMDKQLEQEKLNIMYENKKQEYNEYKESVKKLQEAKLVVDSIINRQFRSNAQAANYLSDYSKRADKLLKKMTEKRLGLSIDEEFQVLDNKNNPIEFNTLNATDLLLIYIACAQSAPILDGDADGWLVIDGNIATDREQIEKALADAQLDYLFYLETQKNSETVIE